MTPSDAAKDQTRSADHMTKADEPRENNGEYVHVYGYLTYHSKDEARLYQGLGNDEYYAFLKSGVKGLAHDASKENPCLARVTVPSDLSVTYVGKGKATLPAATLAKAIAAHKQNESVTAPAGPCRPGCGTPGNCYCLVPGCWFDKDDAELKQLGIEIVEKPAKS
jgi:hypothetical protein